jgi:polyhydroxybutyrate depolymerase
MSRTTVVLAIALAAAWSSGCGDDPITEPAYGGGDLQASLTSSGMTRTYRLHVPATITPEEPVPLVIVLHGASQDGNAIRRLSGFDAVADERGVLVAYLDGSRDITATWTYYGFVTSDVDDVQFVTDVIDTLAATFAIDRNRVYAAGYSNGGLFALQLGCQLRGRLAAISTVAASLSVVTRQLCTAETVIPAVFIHGTEDEAFLWTGTLDFMAPEEMLRLWAELNGCTSGPTLTPLPDVLDDGTTVQRHDYEDCARSPRISLYAVEGGRHTWPASAEFAASEEIMDFFQEVTR